MAALEIDGAQRRAMVSLIASCFFLPNGALKFPLELSLHSSRGFHKRFPAGVLSDQVAATT